MGAIRYVAQNRTETALDGLTELRVHGVGGAMPEDLLDEPHPRQVAGDRIAGFFRRDDIDGRHVEAYSWGGLTSRSGVRVLWLLLLPFTFANLAGWMYRPDAQGRPPLGHRALLRLLGFALTLVYVLWLCSIALDLIAFQCGGQPTCVDGRWWLTPLSGSAVAGYPARRLLVGLAAPLAVVGLLGFLARTTSNRYEHMTTAGHVHAPDLVRAQEQCYTGGLSSPCFWFGEPLVRRLGKLHIAGGLTLLAYTLTGSVLALQLGGAAALVTGAALRWAGLALLAAIALAVCAPARAGERVVRLASAGSAVLIVAAAVFAVTRPAGSAPAVPGQLPGWREVATVVLALQVLGLVALGLLTAGASITGRRTARSASGATRPGFRWGGPLVASTLAALMLHSFFAGTAVRVADLHGRPVPTGIQVPTAGGPWLVYPQVYDLFSVALLVVGTVVVVLCALAWRRLWVRTGAPRLASIPRDYVHEPPPSARSEPAWIRRIARMRCLSEAVDSVDVVLTSTAVVTLALAAWGLAMAFGLVTTEAAQRISDLSTGSLSWVWTAATWVSSTVPLVAVALMRYAYADPDLRRKVSVVWDVGTFWPRAYHPLAPPCYSERAVLDLCSRMRRIIEEHGGRVLLSAHSQGTVLAAAALLQLPMALRRSIGFVTYGCPLSRLYGRFFPAFLSPEVFAGLARSLSDAGGRPRWQNFWRDTDLIGGRVLPEPGPATAPRLIDDVFLRDPATSRYVQTDPWPPIAGHTGYLEDVTMAARVSELAEHLRNLTRPRTETGSALPVAERETGLPSLSRSR